MKTNRHGFKKIKVDPQLQYRDKRRNGMKKTFQKVICSAMILTMALPFAACGNRNESWSTEPTVPENPSALDPDVTTITFAVPEFSHIDNNHLRLFNNELLNDGYKYQLKINTFEYDFEKNQYFIDIENELKSGNADVAFLGLGDADNNIYRLINSGAVMNLDEVITSDKGKALYEAFPAALWEAGKCNGHIYSIPQANFDDQGIFAAFNKDFISEEAINNWDGSLDGIYNMIKDVKWKNSAPRFQYLISDFGFDGMIGCEIRNGVLYDYDTMKIVNALESEKFINYMKVLEKMKNEGFMAESVSYYQNSSYAEEEANLSSGKYLVALSSGEPEAYYAKENIVIKKLAPAIPSRINASIGISSKTNKLDAVLDFLGILYGEEKYGNLLLYGQQDTNYKLKDGLVVNMDGSEPAYDFMAKVSLNLFINVHPVKGELYTANRKEDYFAFYNGVKSSPFLGFEADIAGNGTIENDLNGFLDSLMEKSLDNAVKEYSAKLKSDGIDEYLNSLNKQWETFHK